MKMRAAPVPQNAKRNLRKRRRKKSKRKGRKKRKRRKNGSISLASQMRVRTQTDRTWLVWHSHLSNQTLWPKSRGMGVGEEKEGRAEDLWCGPVSSHVFQHRCDPQGREGSSQVPAVHRGWFQAGAPSSVSSSLLICSLWFLWNGAAKGGWTKGVSGEFQALPQPSPSWQAAWLHSQTSAWPYLLLKVIKVRGNKSSLLYLFQKTFI